MSILDKSANNELDVTVTKSTFNLFVTVEIKPSEGNVTRWFAIRPQLFPKTASAYRHVQPFTPLHLVQQAQWSTESS